MGLKDILGGGSGSGLGGVVQGLLGSRGASKASKQQQAGITDGINTVRDTLGGIESSVTPYTGLGSNVGTYEQAVLGNDGYQDPLLGQVQNQIMDNISQNSAATGRYGAGEMPGLMAQALVEPAMQMRQQRINNLSGLATMGMNAQFGLNDQKLLGARDIADRYSNRGQVRAEGTLGRYAGYQSAVKGLDSMAQSNVFGS